MLVFTAAAVIPASGEGLAALDESQWTSLKARLLPYERWLLKQPADEGMKKLTDLRVRAIARSGVEAKIQDLIAKDAALAEESNQIESVEKMIRFRRDFLEVLRNFVSFADFYNKRRGAFQAGTLYIDGRSCELCMYVDDPAKHVELGALSKAFLAYCEITRTKEVIKKSIVAAVTGGDIDNLMVGRNGVFYDRKGNDWNAKIVRIVPNPISVRQAFWAPYKRFIRLIEEQIAKRAAAEEAEADRKMQEMAAVKAINEAAKAPPAPAPAAPAPPPAAPGAAPAPAAPPKPPEEKKIDVGTVAALGVAIGGIAAFFSSIVATMLGLGPWMPAGLLALILAISGPSMLIAWLKLRQRNIGPLLDANGWAVNAFARVNVPFGGALTAEAKLPAGASRTLKDPFGEKRRPWGLYLTLLAIVALAVTWFLGKFDTYLPQAVKAETVFQRAPAAASAPASSAPAAASSK